MLSRSLSHRAALVAVGAGLVLTAVAPVAAGASAAVSHAATRPTLERLKVTQEAVNSTGCVSTTLCFAVGTSATGHGEVTKVISGVPQTPHTVSGVSALAAISCPASNKPCEAVGSTGSHGVSLKISRTGSVGHPITLPLLFSDISCARSASLCEADSYTSSSLNVLALKNGKPKSVRTVKVPAGTSSAISCVTPTFCEVAGTYTAFNSSYTAIVSEGFAVPVVKRQPGKAVLFATGFGIHGIGCVAVGRCIVAESTMGGASAQVATLSGGKLKRVVKLPQVSSLAAVTCRTSTRCTGIGVDSARTAAVVVNIDHGQPSQPLIVSGASYFSGAACPSSTLCEAFGVKKHRATIVHDVVGTIGF